MMVSPNLASTAVRKPYHGSCHCGTIRYIAYLTLPPCSLTVEVSPTPTNRMEKCNCTSCHKTSFFHVRLIDAPNDFMILSPLAPQSQNQKQEKNFGGLDIDQIGDYVCGEGFLHWLFCRNCGVRCFTLAGGEVTEVEVPNEKSGERERETAWRPKAEGWNEAWKVEDGESYLSVNAGTLEAGQEGLSLNEWSEKGWILYWDFLREEGGGRFGEPYEGGMY